MTAPKQRVVIDTDPGVDDALAILLALRSPELEVVAITTVCGNVPVEQATQNLFRVLGLLKPPAGLLIGQGAAKPLRQPLQTATQVHGADGLGELDSFRNQDGSPRYPRPKPPRTLPTAQEVWGECLRRYPGELTLITLGPLTNLAIALETDPAPLRQLRSVISMGGAISVTGNVTPAAEFNIYVDPHAAQRVFQSGLPITLVPLDVTTKVALNRNEIQTLATGGSGPVPRFVADATGQVLSYTERVEGAPLFHLHDPLAVAVAIDPSLVQTVPFHVEVETEDQASMGKTRADRGSLGRAQKASSNIQAALKVDAARALKLFTERLSRK
ncbi:MAG: nucleoside hydrolase [Nitrospirae bacterium]|nr:MAG: nucleoside hydrolase [Nitrospirota bacterium]